LPNWARCCRAKLLRTLGPLALVELLNGSDGSPQYVAGIDNFYAITRYNWSSYYAMTVIALGAEVKAIVQRGAR
jgi:membrane-bound lytic murein transglycosylase B